ncbi:MAG: twin-arginine translocation signal domain-containing protein [Pseudomonadota bacterium]
MTTRRAFLGGTYAAASAVASLGPVHAQNRGSARRNQDLAIVLTERDRAARDLQALIAA